MSDRVICVKFSTSPSYTIPTSRLCNMKQILPLHTFEYYPDRNYCDVSIMNYYYYYYYYEKVGTRFHKGEIKQELKVPQGKQVQLEMTRILHKN